MKLRKLTLLCCLLLAAGGSVASTAQAENTRVSCPGIVKGINYHRHVTWRLQSKLGLSKIKPSTRHFTSCAYATWVNGYWNKLAKHFRKLLSQHRTLFAGGGDMAAWLCIHRYEGSWTDSGAPYWGGLQMDIGFQETYGSDFMHKWGTANNWPIWAQIEAARRARDGYNGHGGRGYNPWPNTAHYCGLI